jgi:hypothetical protein
MHDEETWEQAQIREALKAHRHATAAGESNAEHAIYDDVAIGDIPESGMRKIPCAEAICLAAPDPVPG